MSVSYKIQLTFGKKRNRHSSLVDINLPSPPERMTKRPELMLNVPTGLMYLNLMLPNRESYDLTNPTSMAA